jgi:sporulation protein YlmC with PRC-barrel domain
VRLLKVNGLPVVDTHLARQAGVVSDVLLDLHAGCVAVLNVKHGDGWQVQRIPARFIHRLGPREVLVSDTVAVDLGAPRPDQPWFPIQSVVGLQVMSERGEVVGHLTDAELDEQTLAVRTYFVRHLSGGWRRSGRLQPDDVLNCSAEMMLVRHRTAV